MLKPIEYFPYENRNKRDSLNGKLLLMELRGFSRYFTIGYYSASRDVFYMWPHTGFMPEGKKSDEDVKLDGMDVLCTLPKEFKQCKGARFIKGYVPLGKALKAMIEQNMLIEDIEGYLDNVPYCASHLIWTKDNHIFTSQTGCFCEEGNQFEAIAPQTINDSVYHLAGPVPRDMIKYAVNLIGLRYEYDPPRMVNADRLFEKIKMNDLSYMQQADVMDCIKDTIERCLKNPD